MQLWVFTTTLAVLKMKIKALHPKNSENNNSHIFLAIFTTGDTTVSRNL